MSDSDTVRDRLLAGPFQSGPGKELLGEIDMVFKKKPVPVFNLLLIMDAFVLGGCVMLLLMNRLLDRQLTTSAPHGRSEAEVLLALVDGLLPYYVAFAGVLALLILITVGAWAWRTTGSQSTLKDDPPKPFASNADDNVWPRIITSVDHLPQKNPGFSEKQVV